MNLESKVIDWRKAFEMVEVKTEPVVCFRIKPDKSITNYSNYKFFKDMAELEEISNLRENFQRVAEFGRNLLFKKEREGFKIVYKSQTNYVWYEIVIKAKAINFYVLCYRPNRDFVKMKLEQVFPHAPIEIVDEEETKIPEENTMIADLKLQRHNFFSIRTDYSEQAQPIEDILACAEDVRENDVLKFSLRAQPYDRNYWSYKAEEWEGHTRKGKAPKRLRIGKNSVVNGLFGVSDMAFQKLGELFRTIHQVAFKKYETNQVVIHHSTSETREIGEISRQTHYKMTAPVFRTVMRVASHSDSFTRRNMNLKGMSASFIDVKDTNNSIVRTAIYEKPEGTEKRVKPTLIDKLLKREPEPKKESWSFEEWRWKCLYEEVSNHKVTPISAMEMDYNIMCDKELGKIQMLPTAKIQRKHEEKMESLTKVENPVPKEFQPENGLPVGVAEFKGESFEVGLPQDNPDESHLPIVAAGIQGSGKDTFAINVIYEQAIRGNGAVILDVIDEHERGMSDMLIKLLPKEKLAVIDFSDPDYAPYLDWAEAMSDIDGGGNRFDKSKFGSELVKFFEAEDEAGIQTERYLRESAKAMNGESIIRMGNLFLSEELRAKTIAKLKKNGDIATAVFWENYGNEGEGRQRQIASPILNRLHKLHGDEALKPLFGQKPTGKIDFDTLLTEGKVIICKMPKDLYTTNGIRTLVHWLTVKTWLTKQKHFRQDRIVSTTLVLNEPHQFFTKGLINTLEEMFPEGRKFQLRILTLFHDLSQVDNDLFDIMESAGSNFVLLKQKGTKIWKRYEHKIKDYYDMDECVNIESHEAIIGFTIKKKDVVLRVKMNDMPHNRGAKVYDNTGIEREHIMLYGRPIEEIEKEIQEDEMMLMNAFKKKVKK